METAVWETSSGRCYKNILTFSQFKQAKATKHGGVAEEEEGSVSGPTHFASCCNSCRSSLCYPIVGLETTITPVDTHFELFFGHITTAAWVPLSSMYPAALLPRRSDQRCPCTQLWTTHSLLRNQTKQAVCKTQATPSLSTFCLENNIPPNESINIPIHKISEKY